METKYKLDLSWMLVNFIVLIIAFACGIGIGISIEQGRSNYCENCDKYYVKSMSYCYDCGEELQRVRQ